MSVWGVLSTLTGTRSAAASRWQVAAAACGLENWASMGLGVACSRAVIRKQGRLGGQQWGSGAVSRGAGVATSLHWLQRHAPRPSRLRRRRQQQQQRPRYDHEPIVVVVVGHGGCGSGCGLGGGGGGGTFAGLQLPLRLRARLQLLAQHLESAKPVPPTTAS